MNRVGSRISLVFSAILFVVGTGFSQGDEVKSATKPGPDQVLADLSKLVGKDMVDPQGLERVRFKMTLRGVWGQREEFVIGGWRNPDDEKIFFNDGVEVPEGWASDVEPVDLLASVRKLYPKKAAEDADPFFDFRLNAVGLESGIDVAYAAWMQVLGERELARRALAEAQAKLRGKQTLPGLWRSGRAWFYYAGMVHAFMQGADDEAEEYGELLLARYPEEAGKNHKQARALLEEIRRRKAHPLAKPLDHPEALPPDKQSDYWIGRLEAADVEQDGQPGGVDLSQNKAVMALIKIGDPAIPKLLDVFERDKRFTRSVSFWRDGAPYRTVLGVHEAAFVAIMAILRTRFFDTACTGDNLTSRGDEQRARIAKQLRTYWDRYGALPIDKRMMAILTDPEASAEARREAAFNLATPGATQIIGTTVWTDRLEYHEKDNPNAAKFHNPTVAEAMLAAFDDEVQFIAEKNAEEKRKKAAGEKKEGPDDWLAPSPYDPVQKRREAADEYTHDLELLGDRSVAPVLVRRADAAMDIVIRCFFASAAEALGDPGALAKLRDEFVANCVPPPEKSDSLAVRAVFGCFVRAKTKDAMRALHSIARRDHRWFPAMLRYVLEDTSTYDNRILRDAWCVELLGGGLGDSDDAEDNSKSPVDGSAERPWHECQQEGAALLLLKLLGDHTELKAKEFRKNRQPVLADLRRYLKLHAGRFRNLSEWVDGGTGWAIEEGRFVPVLPPLGRAAIKDDVSAGKALFYLEDPGPPPAIEVPVASVWLGKQGSGFSGEGRVPDSEVVVLQIERDRSGKLWFGVANGNGFFVVPSEKIGVLYPIP